MTEYQCPGCNGCPSCDPELAELARANNRGDHRRVMEILAQRDQRMGIRTFAGQPPRNVPAPPSLEDAFKTTPSDRDTKITQWMKGTAK